MSALALEAAKLDHGTLPHIKAMEQSLKRVRRQLKGSLDFVDRQHLLTAERELVNGLAALRAGPYGSLDTAPAKR